MNTVKTRWMIGRWLTAMLAMMFVVAVGSCGSKHEDPVGPGDTPGDTTGTPDTPTTGTFQGYVQDNPSVPSGNTDTDDNYTGTLTGRIDVEISQDGVSWRSLGPPSDVTLALQSSSARFQLSGKVEVPAGTYTHVRINFNQAGFVIDKGSVVNGVTLNSDVQMRLGDTGSGVAKPNITSFTLSGGENANIIIELNSETWLTVNNLQSRQVPKGDVEQHTNVMLVQAG